MREVIMRLTPKPLEDEEHAKRMGEDLIYEYMARKAGIT